MPLASLSPPRRRDAVALACCLAAAVALRAPLYGNPLIWIDEQLYQLVGQQILAGQWPYVDSWDRKPIGLFLIYAAAALFPDEVLAYQLIATAFAAATGFLVHRLALAFAPYRAALAAGLVYQLYLSAFHCFGGQAPVFFNLPMAAAALLVLGLVRGAAAQAIGPRGLAAMALVGLAIQIKYTPLFEGAAFGLTLIFVAVRAGFAWPRLAGWSAAWAGAALLPTAAVSAVYALAGYWSAFAWANFASIFAREVFKSWWVEAASSAGTLAGFAVAALALLVRWRRRGRPPVTLAWRFLLAWTAAAIAGFLVMGPYSDHYRAPLLVPFCVVAAPVLFRRARPTPVLGVLIALGLALAVPRTLATPREGGTAAELAAATARLRPLLARGCLFLFDGAVAPYRTTGACRVTRFAFPQHLSEDEERGALGVAQTVEIARALARRPAVIVVFAGPPPRDPRRDLVFAALARSYRHAFDYRLGLKHYAVYALRPPAGRRSAVSAPPG